VRWQFWSQPLAGSILIFIAILGPGEAAYFAISLNGFATNGLMHKSLMETTLIVPLIRDVD
jgi:hypothetical protein